MRGTKAVILVRRALLLGLALCLATTVLGQTAAADPAQNDWHDVTPVGGSPGAKKQAYDIVGPVCETGDTFAVARELPECRPGDLLAIAGTGAYGAAMASTYNSRPLAAEVLLDAGRYAIVRERQTFDQMIAGEQPARAWRTT